MEGSLLRNLGMLMKRKGDKFSWFKIEHYAPTKCFSFAEWAIMLSRREKWHAELRARSTKIGKRSTPKRSHNEKTLAPEAQKEIDTHSGADYVWSSYVDDVLPWIRPHLTRHQRKSWRDAKSLSALPAVTDITDELLNKNNTMPYFVEFNSSFLARAI